MSRTLVSRLSPVVPARGWLRGYKPGGLRADVVAGVTLGACLRPSAIGVASLAGLPPQAGLHARLLSGLLFRLFTSRVARIVLSSPSRFSACAGRHRAPSLST